MKKIAISFSAACTFIALAGLPAQAQTSQSFNDNPLTQIFNQLQQQVSSMKGYLGQLGSSQLKAISSNVGQDVSQIISDATGALGIPDPFQSRDGVQKASTSNGTIYSSGAAANAVDGQITRASAASVLSSGGQTQMQQEAQNTQTAVTATGQQAQTAVDSVSTQDVVKQMAQQNAQNAAIAGSLNVNMQRQIEAQNLGNLNLSNISSEVTGANQGQNLETLSQGRENFKRAARARLF